MKSITILDAIYEVAKAWDKTKASTISKSWRKILPEIDVQDVNSDQESEITLAELAAILKTTPGCENVDAENIEEWFQVDCAVPGHELQSDEQIVKRAQGINDSSDDDEEESTLIPDKRISHSSALEWTENLLDYLEQQDDSLLSDKLLLRKLRSTIRKKESASLKQKTIKDYYFNYSSVQFRNFV